MIESKLIPKALFSDKSVKSVNNLKDSVGIEYIASMNQTHSDVVTFVRSSRIYDSDGIYTEKPELGLVVQTADCMPILLSDKKRIGAYPRYIKLKKIGYCHISELRNFDRIKRTINQVLFK